MTAVIKMAQLVRVLASRVITVASINDDVGEWTAFIDAVPGMNHDEEWQAVLYRGTKLDERIAKVIFPEFTHLRWRR